MDYNNHPSLDIGKGGKMFNSKKLTALTIVMLCSSTSSFAEEVPSNSLQVEYKKQQAQTTPEDSLISLDTVYQIPKATYQYLDDVFTSFYKTVTFQTTITDSTFTENDHYELVSIPIISDDNQGLEVELFGNFSDSATNRMSNFSSDQALSSYYSNTQLFDIYDSEFSFGAGVSFNTGKDSKIKIIISNQDIPGYGKSTALFGFETSF